MMKATKLELESLYEAAKEFEKLHPWEWINEYQLLVVEDPETRMMGFCCIMGNKSDEKGLKVYLGTEGLKHYIEMLDLNQLTIEDETFGSLLSRETCLSVSLGSIQELKKDDLSQLQLLNLSLKPGQFIPKFRDCLAGFLPITLNEGWQSRFLTQALKQVSQLAVLLKETPSFLLSDDQILLRLQDLEGDWKTLKVSLSVFLEQMNDSGVHYGNELAAYRISKLPSTNMVFEIAQFLMPRPVEEDNHTRPYYPMITAVLEKESKQLVFAEMTNPSLESQEQIVSQFANTLLKDLEFKPQCLVTDCEAILKHFKDFSDKTKIPLQRVNQLEAATEFVNDLLKIGESFDLSQDFDEEQSIDMVLLTTQEICRNILECESLTRNLSDRARRQFTNIMELFHVVMLGNFQEFPDHWSVENVERACKEILPELLTQEELSVVPDILSHYLDIVGEAELIPNYVTLKQCVNEIYS